MPYYAVWDASFCEIGGPVSGRPDGGSTCLASISTISAARCPPALSPQTTMPGLEKTRKNTNKYTICYDQLVSAQGGKKVGPYNAPKGPKGSQRSPKGPKIAKHK